MEDKELEEQHGNTVQFHFLIITFLTTYFT